MQKKMRSRKVERFEALLRLDAILFAVARDLSAEGFEECDAPLAQAHEYLARQLESLQPHVYEHYERMLARPTRRKKRLPSSTFSTSPARVHIGRSQLSRIRRRRMHANGSKWQNLADD
jgi:hypothetical protein